MAQKINMLGKTYGLLTVIDYAPSDKNGNAMWKCQCSCGNEIIVQGIKLRNGNTKSCGCVRVNKLINDNQKRIKDIS